ncbi:uncharacterized protein LOC143026525 [Oratosquilla oratoria]|uniref:uncharacterized protein LOC143026525 n=1 Tax=Oratosquilla oratoria TaxID=337810 RepID=UPI003F766FD2
MDNTRISLSLYLEGKDSLLKRLDGASNAFFAPLNIPPPQKEDVVITWLTQLAISKKINTFTSEEVEKIWGTLKKILSSQRFESLILNRWLCPITSSFIQTLACTIRDKGVSHSVREKAVGVCGVLAASPHLSHLLTPQFSPTITSSVFLWIYDENLCDENMILAQTLVKDVDSHLHGQGSKAIEIVVEHLLLQAAKLISKLNVEKTNVAKKLIDEIERVLASHLFNKDVKNLYSTMLGTILCKESKKLLPRAMQKLLTLIISAVTSEDAETVICLLNLVYGNFVHRYKQEAVLQYQMFVAVCHILGFASVDENHICVDNNSLAGNQLSSQERLEPDVQETLLSSVLSIAREAKIDVTTEINGVSLNVWLKGMLSVFIKRPPVTVHGYGCVQNALAYSPMIIIEQISNFFSVVLLCEKTDAMYDSFDSLLCDILDVYVRLRLVPKLYSVILMSLQENKSKLEAVHVVPGPAKTDFLLPPRFLSRLSQQVSVMGHQQVLQLWNTILHHLNSNYEETATQEGDAGQVKYGSLVAYLMAHFLQTSPLMNVVEVVGMPVRLGNLMVRTGPKATPPILTAMLSHPHDNDICSSLLQLYFAWGEAHIKLMTTERGYEDTPDLPKIAVPELGVATNCSYLFPFVNSDTWAQIAARVANFGNSPTQLAMVHLVLQKLCQTEHIQSQETRKDAKEALAKFLLTSLESHNPEVRKLLSSHISYIIPVLNGAQIQGFARKIADGLRQQEIGWKECSSVGVLAEMRVLHPYLLSSCFSSIASILASVKRKHISGAQENEDVVSKAHYCVEILKKISKLCPLLEEFGDTRDCPNDLWEGLTQVGEMVNTLLEDTENLGNGLCGSEEEFCDALQIIHALPLLHLSTAYQTIILLAVLPLLLREGCQSRRERISIELLRLMNMTLCSPCPFRLYHMVKPLPLLRWLINQNKQLSSIAQRLPNVLLPTLDGEEIRPRDTDIKTVTVEKPEVKETDHLLISLLKLFISQSRNNELVQTVADTIIVNADSECDAQSYLRPTMIYINVCKKNIADLPGTGRACAKVVDIMSTWVLHLLKKTALDSISSKTAAAILHAHASIISVKAFHKKQEKTENDQITKEDKTEVVDQKGKKSKKSQRWIKLLNKSVQLSRLCLSGSDTQLEELALTFLTTVGEHAEDLSLEFPEGLVSTAWGAVLCQKMELEGPLQQLLSVASQEDYSELLVDLTSRTQKALLAVQCCGDSTNVSVKQEADQVLTNTLKVWKSLIDIRVEGQKGQMKRDSIELLITMLVGAVAVKKPDADDITEVVHLVLSVLLNILNCGIHLSVQTMATILAPCTSLQLHRLSCDQFLQVYNIIIGVLNSLVTRHPALVVERVSSLLAALSQVTLGLISQTRQDKELSAEKIKVFTNCALALDRVVRELSRYRTEVNKIVHFTVGAIVEAMQQITIYPAVKEILQQILYRLLDLCDRHCLKHLLVALPSASTSLLKELHSNYIKYHRFKPRKV